MKKIITVILFILLWISVKAQYGITQNLGGPNTLIQNPNYGGFRGGLIPYSFNDTIAANLTNLKFYDGAIIFTTDVMALWYRDLPDLKWVQILPSGGAGGLGAWLTTRNLNIPTDISGNGYFGTLAANGIGFYSNSNLRFTLPAGNINDNATPSVKYLGVDTTIGGQRYLTFAPTPTTVVPISSLTAATADNSIENGNYAQQWNWGTLGNNTGLELVSSSTTAAGGNQTLFGVGLSGANATSGQTTFAGLFNNSHTGTASTNIAGRFAATGGTTNIGVLIPNGSLNIGSASSETGVIKMIGATSGTVTIQPQAAAGTFNFNLPTTAGTSGYLLQSAGGGSSAMTWVNPSSIVTNPPINTLTAATAGNAINNGAFTQDWQWNSLTNNIGLSLSSGASTATGNAQTVLSVQNVGPNGTSSQTTYATKIFNGKTGTSSTDNALWLDANGGTTNNALFISRGNIVAPLSNGATTDSIVTWNSTTKVFGAVNASSIVTPTPTLQQAITAGSTLSTNNTINGGNHTIEFSSNNVANIKAASEVFIEQKTAVGSQPRSSVDLTSSTLTLNAYTGTAPGTYVLQNMNNTDDTTSYKPLARNPANGNWRQLNSWPISGGGGTPALAATQIAFGDGSNLMTSSSKLSWGDNGDGLHMQGYYPGNDENIVFNFIPSSNLSYIDATVSHSTKFGINTSTPSVALDVVGRIKVDATGAGDNVIKSPYDNILGDQDNGIYINISGSNNDNVIYLTGAPVTVSNLSGTGTRGVTADAGGVLGTTVGTLTSVVASGDFTGQTATKSSVTTYTPAGDGAYQILAYSDITAISAATLTITCSYTDTHSNSRTATFFGMGTTTAGIGATGSSNFPPIGLLNVKGGTAITVVATFTGVSITYDVSAKIIAL